MMVLGAGGGCDMGNLHNRLATQGTWPSLAVTDHRIRDRAHAASVRFRTNRREVEGQTCLATRELGGQFASPSAGQASLYSLCAHCDTRPQLTTALNRGPSSGS